MIASYYILICLSVVSLSLQHKLISNRFILQYVLICFVQCHPVGSQNTFYYICVCMLTHCEMCPYFCLYPHMMRIVAHLNEFQVTF